MARAWVSGDYISTESGTIPSTSTGFTLAAIVYLTSVAAFQRVVAVARSGGMHSSLNVDSSGRLMVTSQSTTEHVGTLTVPANRWVLLAVSKPTGTVAARLDVYDFSTGGWSTDTTSTTMASPSSTSTRVYFGSSTEFLGSSYLRGSMQVCAYYPQQLSQGQLAAMACGLQPWFTAGPQGLWIFDQASINTRVQDWSGRGATQAFVLSLTSVSTLPPPSWSYGHPVLIPTAHAGGGATTVSPGSVTSTAVLGSPTVAAGVVAVAPASVAAVAAVGSPTITATTTVAPASIAAVSAVGAPTLVPGAVSVTPASIGATAAVGQPTVAAGAVTAAPASIGPGSAVGSPTVAAGAVAVTPASVATVAAVGSPTVGVGAVAVAPASVGAGSTVGVPAVSSGGTIIAPTSVASVSALGSPTIARGLVVVLPAGVGSAIVLGSPTLTAGGVTTAPAGIAATSTVGVPAVGHTVAGISPDGIASTVVFGVPAVGRFRTIVRPNTGIITRPYTGTITY